MSGGATEEGPWIDGLGATPSEAMNQAFCALGIAYGQVEQSLVADEQRREAGLLTEVRREMDIYDGLWRDRLRKLEETFRRWAVNERGAGNVVFASGQWDKGERLKACADVWGKVADEVGGLLR
ncbi:MAG: hypothetical protein QUS11_06580 [Candidatus Fermentibacter sp.]|nr:hypothetical protein [Candidatus Fermentibacter sp.]